MSIIRKIVISVILIAVIPLLVVCYFLTDISTVVSTKGLIIAATFFLSAMGIVGLRHLTRTLKEFCRSLSTIARGDVNHRAQAETSSGIADLAMSINQVSQRLRESADELEKRTILVERFNRELKRTSTFNAAYLSNIVHELRAPLINIDKSSTILLENKVDTDKQNNFLKTISSSAKRLIRLISDLLDISKMEAGCLSIHCAPFPIKEAIDDAVNSVDNWRESKKHKLKVNVPADLPEAYADKDRVVQVVVNLLSNAIKFTAPGGKIAIEAKMHENELEDNGKSIEVSVHDTGVGIPACKKDNIFERYQSGPNGAPDAVPGTGLGLPIAKQIVQMHGGKIWAVTYPGKGTRVTFTLPLNPVENRPIPPQSAKPAEYADNKIP